MDKIIVIEGQAKGTSYPLNENEITIGRARECQIRLPEADVSRQHLKVMRQGDSWMLVDAGSRNGVNVNGENSAQRLLKGGDRIRVGGTCVLRFESAPPISGHELKTVAAPSKTDTSPEAATLAPQVALTGEAAAQIKRLRAARDAIVAEVSKVIHGQGPVIEQILIALFARGNVLLVGVPGLAKTLMIRTIASALDLDFKRVQFTPDLMPSDITGTEVLDEDPNTKERIFRFIKGPIFTNILLADEINRTPPKTQAALLEAMQEQRVTAAGYTYTLKPPFFVLATQNPIEQEGTYPLPEAQLDRFMFMLKLDYPDRAAEIDIVQATTRNEQPTPQRVLSGDEIVSLQALVRNIPVSDYVATYATDLVRASRPKTPQAPKFVNDFVTWGAGTRAAQFLVLGAKARALLDGRINVSCNDVRAVAPIVLRHRIFTNFNADAEGITSEKLIGMLVEAVKEPNAKDLPK